MRKSEKAERVRAVLDDLIPETPIPLEHTDAFTLLVAVLLSAQTTDEQVNKVTPALFQRAPSAAALAALDEAEILAFIKSCGLAPTKAKNLRALARRLVDEHAGAVPPDLAVLETLPGVGHKTASVVMAQAFGVPAFPVDTHIHRLAARWGLSGGRRVEDTERDLKRLYPSDAWNRLHLQIIYFGRRYCPARRHDLTACPICSWAASKRRISLETATSSRGRLDRGRLDRGRLDRGSVDGRVDSGRVNRDQPAAKSTASRSPHPARKTRRAG